MNNSLLNFHSLKSLISYSSCPAALHLLLHLLLTSVLPGLRPLQPGPLGCGRRQQRAPRGRVLQQHLQLLQPGVVAVQRGGQRREAGRGGQGVRERQRGQEQLRFGGCHRRRRRRRRRCAPGAPSAFCGRTELLSPAERRCVRAAAAVTLGGSQHVEGRGLGVQRRPIYGQSGKRAPQTPRGSGVSAWLRVLEHEGSGRVQTMSPVCWLQARRTDRTGAGNRAGGEPPWPETPEPRHGPDQVLGAQPAASSLPRALFGRLPVGLLVGARGGGAKQERSKVHDWSQVVLGGPSRSRPPPFAMQPLLDPRWPLLHLMEQEVLLHLMETRQSLEHMERLHHKFFQEMDRSWSQRGVSQRGVSQRGVSQTVAVQPMGGGGFALSLDTAAFSPKELSVKQVGRRLRVSGRTQSGQEDTSSPTSPTSSSSSSSSPSSSYWCEEFMQDFQLPDGVDPEAVTCSLLGGRLQIQAPKERAVHDGKERLVPIHLTSPTSSSSSSPSSSYWCEEFMQEFQLPDGVDPEAVTCSLLGGRLQIQAPKERAVHDGKERLVPIHLTSSSSASSTSSSSSSSSTSPSESSPAEIN
ncbi:Heat shock protein beta-11 [Liparis tanakae]|uniref:Heat shock protein beta-11 n=1 Tax=Liparis tanakae TaxID=230148 RepID=A0A4Z2FYA8_9TELE|nr:Heat shock protein beta-11 [Liparis tanakae]